MLQDWRRKLRDARKALGLNQQELASLAGVSPETVRGYENGRRTPRRERFIAVLDALGLGNAERRHLMVGAGFAPDGGATRPSDEIWYSVDEAVEHTQRLRWPAFVIDEFARVVGANPVLQRLWDVDLQHDANDPAERHLLAVASNTSFAERCLNWDEALSAIISVFKARNRAPADLEEPAAPFAAMLDRRSRDDSTYISRLLDIWQRTPGADRTKARWTYPVVWNQPGAGTMRFEALTSSASEVDGLAFTDWIPLDAETWRCLEKVTEE